MFHCLAESFLEKPTAFGVPLGALLLFFWLMRAINESKTSNDQNRGQASTGVVADKPSSQRSGFSVSTESIPLMGEVDDSVVKFLRSGFKNDGRRAVIEFRVRLGESGNFVVAAGKHEAGRLNRAHHGFTMVSGDADEIIYGTVSCPGFSSGKWAIGAFRSVDDIALS